MKSFIIVVFLFLVPVMPAQERVKISKISNRASIEEAARFWSNTQQAQTMKHLSANGAAVLSTAPSLPPTPGIVEVMGPFEYDEAYTKVRFVSKDLPAGNICIGWKLTKPVGAQSLDNAPVCFGSSRPQSFEIELFRGAFDIADWTGTYPYQVFVEVNGVMSQVTGYINFSSGQYPPPVFTGAIINDSQLTVTGGNFTNPTIYYDGSYINDFSLTANGLVGTTKWNPTGRLLTVCDNGQCNTQVVYKLFR